ncbi:unnamed protein product, partial [Meganyctiphanes norvegica]
LWIFIICYVAYISLIFEAYMRLKPINHYKEKLIPRVSTRSLVAQRLHQMILGRVHLIVTNETNKHFLKPIENERLYSLDVSSLKKKKTLGGIRLKRTWASNLSKVNKAPQKSPPQYEGEPYSQWCRPKVMPYLIYLHDAEKGHIETFMYEAKDEDFGSSDASKLDTWVFDQVESFFKNAHEDSKLKERLHQDRIVFFLHLLGIDTNGHAHKPHSEEYQRNIEIVDTGVKKVQKMFEEFYKDNKTAFVFTSDHGMTDWGSHGAGDPSETEVPIVAWGAGFAAPEDPSKFRERMLYDDRVEKWGLAHVRRHDMNQADLAPLMASVIGIPVPVNSMGSLPVEYMNASEMYKAEALFANCRQLLFQYRTKRAQKEKDTLGLFYRPFQLLMPDREMEMLTDIRKHIKDEEYQEAIDLSHYLMSLSERGLDYYHNYDRPALTATITLGFLGWIVLVICHLLQDHSAVLRMGGNTVEGRRAQRQSLVWPVLLTLWGTAAFLLLSIQNAPLQYYLYFLTPVGLWWLVYQRLGSLRVAMLIITAFNMVWEVGIRFLFIFVGIEILVVSFFLRPILSVGLLCLGLWPVVMYSLQGSAETSMRLGWFGACVLLASFTFVPVVGKEAFYPAVEFAGLASFCVGAFFIYRIGGAQVPNVMYVQGVAVVASVYLVHTTAFSIQQQEGLPPINQYMAWAILGMSFIFPLLGSRIVLGRLMSVSAALLCPFLLLSIRHEAFFYLALTIAMYLWLILEYYLAGENVQLAALKHAMWDADKTKDTGRVLEWSDLRRAYFYLFFIMLAFFGTGNIASINSFDPSFVYCFVTVFSPFVMGSLLLFKTIIPFLLVTCFFQAICTLIQVPQQAMFYMFLVMSDFMALQFFFLIRTEGSWLDIGASLSHFIICMATTVFLMLLLLIAKFLTTFNLIKSSGKEEPVLLSHVNTARPHRD